MNNMGVEVRELKELSSYDDLYDQIFKHFMKDGLGVGIACDIARMLINYDMGGLYLDLDAYIEEYNP